MRVDEPTIVGLSVYPAAPDAVGSGWRGVGTSSSGSRFELVADSAAALRLGSTAEPYESLADLVMSSERGLFVQELVDEIMKHLEQVFDLPREQEILRTPTLFVFSAEEQTVTATFVGIVNIMRVGVFPPPTGGLIVPAKNVTPGSGLILRP